MSFRADADRDASHPNIAHHVRSLQQRPAEGAAARAADIGEAVPHSRRPPGAPHTAPPAPPGEEEGMPTGGGKLRGRIYHQQNRRPTG